MTADAAVTVSIDVEVDPDTAFDVFANEIDAWYKVDRFTVVDFTRTVAIRFEPGVGGRLLDVYDAETGEGREMGRVVAWEPGRRLVFVDLRDTEVEITFERTTRGTRVTLEHRGLDRLAPDVAEHVRKHGWGVLLPWFADHVKGDDTMSDAAPVRFLGVTPYLYYEDAAAALDWLQRVFGFGESKRYVDADGKVQEAEIAVGDVRIMMTGRGPGADEGAGQLLIVHVDDVDAHFARVKAAGVDAEPPEDQSYGPRTYHVTDPWGYRWYFWQQVRDFVEQPGSLREVRV